MKKLSFFLLLLIFAGGGALFLFQGKAKVIKVTHFVNTLPEGTPYADLNFSKEAKDQGYQLEWTLMQSLPKKRHYLKRLDFFIKNLSTKTFIVNNLNPPFSKANLSRIPKEKLILVLWEAPFSFRTSI